MICRFPPRRIVVALRHAASVLLLGFLLLPASFAASLNERIAVSSTAASNYKREQVGKSGPRPESYIFTKGHFVPGNTRDKALESMSFETLTRTLAPDLAKQAYYPTKDVANADLIIVVHWGTSHVYEDPQKDTNIERLNEAIASVNAQIQEGGIGDVSALNHVSDANAMTQDSVAGAMARNAVLMGYAQNMKALSSPHGFVSEEEKSMRVELSEERFFVVLMAYDYQALKKQKTQQLRWVTRLSVRSPGNNFTEALPVLSKAGSHVFGHNLDGMVHIKANMREAQISLGDLKTLGTVEDESTQSK